MVRTPLHCWLCQVEVDASQLDYEAVLIPRAASRGGPVLVYRCRKCATDNVVERNQAGECLLIPPTLARMKDSNVRGPALARARQWTRDNALHRAEFLQRTAPAMPSPEDAPEPSPTKAREEAPDDDPADSESPAERKAELNTVLQAYEVLGLELTATPEEIRKRYRDLSKKCHPDRVAGLDEEIRRVADRRFREIRNAYDWLVGD